MNYIKLKTLLVFATLVLVSTAFAQHNPDHDVNVNVDVPVVEQVARTVRLGWFGNLLYQAQESVHALVKKATGQEVERFYINICSGDECLPVDPVRFSN